MEKIYNVGDKFTDHVGSIIIEDIGYCFCEYTCCVYYGTKLNKDDVPRKDKSKRKAWQIYDVKNKSIIQ